MSDLVTRAQITLLSRTLHVPEERLAHLERLGAQTLHELQEAMAKAIFAQHNHTFSRLSMLVPVIPLSISLPLVQRLVPPLIAGRAAGAIGVDHPHKAAEALTMLRPDYAADGAPYIDPHAVGQLAEIAPPEPVVRIVNEILRRGDYVTAGPFLAYATPALIAAVEKGAHDDEGLIRSAAYAYSGESVSMVLRHLLDGLEQRVPRLVRTLLAGSDELRLAAVSVFARCDADVIAGIGDILFAEGATEDIGELIRTFVRAGVVPETLRFVGQLSPWALDQLAANPVVAEPESLDAFAVAVTDGADAAIWRGLLEVADRTPPPATRRIGDKLSRLDPELLARLPAVLTETDLWSPLLRVLAVAEPDAQSRIGEVWSALEERKEVERRIADLMLGEQLSALIATLQITH